VGDVIDEDGIQPLLFQLLPGMGDMVFALRCKADHPLVG